MSDNNVLAFDSAFSDERAPFFCISGENVSRTLPFDQNPTFQLAYATFFDMPGIESLKSGLPGGGAMKNIALASTSCRLSDVAACFDEFTLVIRTLQGAGLLTMTHARPGNFWFIDNAVNKVNLTLERALAEYGNTVRKLSDSIVQLDTDPVTLCPLIEMAVVSAWPIRCDTRVEEDEFNARLAYLCAISFMSKRLGVTADTPLRHVGKADVSKHVQILIRQNGADLSASIIQNANAWQLMLDQRQVA
jgi:hypothetical protein